MYRTLLSGRSRRPSARTASFGVFIALFLVCGALYSETATVKLSPLVARSTLVGSVDGTREIGVTLALPLSDPEGAAEFVRHVSTPGDPLFRHYLTPQQFAERFGGNADDYAYLKSWAGANGLRVSHESVGRINLTVRGSVSQFQRLFNTQLSNYRSPDGQEFYSASVEPVVPSELAARISGVIGLTESKMVTPMVKVAKRFGENPPEANSIHTDTAGGTGPGGAYKAADLRTAYDIPTFGHLNPDAVAAVFEQGGYDPSDVTKYFTYNGLPKVTVTPVSVDNSPTDVQDPNVELEAVLDIDMIAGINPAISKIRVYIDSFYWDSFQTALLDAITQVGDDDIAQVFSISYGQDEGYQGTTAIAAENIALAQLAAEGITVTASSGDSGAYGDGYNSPYNVSDPASQPYITGVGGTTLRTGRHELYLAEEAWNELSLGHGATGGGISSYWPLPNFQNDVFYGPINYFISNGGSTTYRNVPDVAAVGDPVTGVAVYSHMNGGWNQIGGTSVSSPIWAGYLTIINAGLQYAGIGNLGWFNPVVYQVGYSTETYPYQFLRGVLEGSNGYAPNYSGYPGYVNGQGYCNTTGNGSLEGSLFGSQLLISGSQPGNKPGSITSFTYSKLTYDSATFRWRPVTGASAYELLLVRLDAYGLQLFQLSLTKETTATVTGLTPDDPYSAYLWAFNTSGGSAAGPVRFTTLKKP